MTTYHAGAAAADADRPITSCPYPIDGTFKDRALAHVWLLGYQRRKRQPATVAT